MAQLELKSGEAMKLPPFSSAKRFPISPKLERAKVLYPVMLQALHDSNQSRVILRSEIKKKKLIILELRNEIERLKQDLTIEADVRIRLYRMSEELVRALREIDDFAEELSGVVLEAHRARRNGLGGFIEKLKELSGRWKVFKAGKRQAIASALMASDDGGRDEELCE